MLTADNLTVYRHTRLMIILRMSYPRGEGLRPSLVGDGEHILRGLNVLLFERQTQRGIDAHEHVVVMIARGLVGYMLA